MIIHLLLLNQWLKRPAATPTSSSWAPRRRRPGPPSARTSQCMCFGVYIYIYICVCVYIYIYIYIVAQYAIVQYTIVYHTIPYNTILYNTILCYNIIYYTILHYTILCYAILCQVQGLPGRLRFSSCAYFGKGQMGSALMGSLQISCFLTDFLGTPVNLLLCSQKCQGVPFSPNPPKFITFAAAP